MEVANVEPCDDDPKVLKARWTSPAGQSLIREVVRRIQHRQSLDRIAGLQKVNGRWDLRGLVLGPATPAGKSYDIRGVLFNQKSGVTYFNHVVVSNCDFSHSEFTDVFWKRSRIEDSIFADTKVSRFGFWGCDIENVSFDRGNFANSQLGVNSDNVPCSFINCSFRKADLRQTSQTITLYRKCQFVQANLEDLDFNGAQFEDCVFEGTLQDVQFRLHALGVMDGRLFVKPVDTTKWSNQMNNIDFSKAKLLGIHFSGVDLSTCKFPSDSEHLVIYNQNKVFRQVRNRILSEWSADIRDDVVSYLDACYLSVEKLHGRFVTPEKLRQPIDVVNVFDLVKEFGENTGEKLFKLLEEENGMRNP